MPKSWSKRDELIYRGIRRQHHYSKSRAARITNYLRSKRRRRRARKS